MIPLPLGPIYSLFKDAYHFFQRNRRHLSNTERLEYRQKWKPQFEAQIWKTHKAELRRDVIIRDVKRLDNYPETDDAKGISPWFRVGLVGTYHRGILVGLSIEGLVKHGETQWRMTDYVSGETSDITTCLIGRILYEDIESVDWEGDEYYGYPHIYCFFTHKKQPYESLDFCIETPVQNSLPFYKEIAPYEQVHEFTKKLKSKIKKSA